MVLQVPSFNYLPIKAQKCSLSLPPLSYDLPFHEGEKRNKRLTGGICGCLIWASLVSSNSPAAGNSYSLLNYKGHIIPAHSTAGE